MSTIQLVDVPKAFKALPHQIAALRFLQEKTPPEVMAEFEEMFRADPEPKPAAALGRWTNPLAVPYFSQRDSTVAGQANRMCFSSSCAMLIAYFKPQALPGPDGDDIYLKRVLCYGDTTDANAQLKALAFFGIEATFVTNASFETLQGQIDRGIPVPCGYLHHGSSSAPSGGGHWLDVIGYTPDAVIVNDPFGEMDVANGGYLTSNGKGLTYSRANWGPRWMADGPGTGWAILAKP